MHCPFARLPSELADSIVHMINNNYNMIKEKCYILERAKFKLASQGAPRIVIFLPTIVLALEVFTYGHLSVTTTPIHSKILYTHDK